jgi:hypothetical protein
MNAVPVYASSNNALSGRDFDALGISQRIGGEARLPQIRPRWTI